MQTEKKEEMLTESQASKKEEEGATEQGDDQEYIKICGQSYLIYMNHFLESTEANIIFFKLVKELLRKKESKSE